MTSKNGCATALVIGLVFFVGLPGTLVLPNAALAAPSLVVYDTGAVGIRATDAFQSLSYTTVSPLAALQITSAAEDPGLSAAPYMFYLWREADQIDAGSLSFAPANFPAAAEFPMAWTYDVGLGQDTALTFDISDALGAWQSGAVIWEGAWGGPSGDSYPIQGYTDPPHVDTIAATGLYHDPPDTTLSGIIGDATTDMVMDGYLPTKGALIDGESDGGTDLTWELVQRDNLDPMPAGLGGGTEAETLVTEIVSLVLSSADPAPNDLMVLEITFDPQTVTDMHGIPLAEMEAAAARGAISMIRNATGNAADWERFVVGLPIMSPYATSGFDLSTAAMGDWGVDTANWAVWAVVNEGGTEHAIIPEPGTVLLLLSGAFCGLFVWRRRRSK